LPLVVKTAYLGASRKRLLLLKYIWKIFNLYIKFTAKAELRFKR
jgi:hypothetical protein